MLAFVAKAFVSEAEWKIACAMVTDDGTPVAASLRCARPAMDEMSVPVESTAGAGLLTPSKR